MSYFAVMIKMLVAIVGLFLPGIAFLKLLTAVCVSKDDEPCALSLIIGGFLIAVFILTAGVFVIGVANISSLTQFFRAYSILSLLCLPYVLWWVVRLCLARRLHRLRNPFKLWRVSIIVLFVFAAFITIILPKMNWDGFESYLSPAATALRLNTVPLTLPSDSTVNTTGFAFPSLTMTVFYSYLLFATRLLEFPGGPIVLADLTNVIFGIPVTVLLFLVLLVFHRYIRLVLRDPSLGKYGVCLLLCCPLLLEYLSTNSLYSDLLFLLLTLTSAYLTMSFLKASTQQSMYAAVLPVAYTLLAITKVDGLVVASVLMIILMSRIFPKLLRGLSAVGLVAMLAGASPLIVYLRRLGGKSTWHTQALYDPDNILILIGITVFLFSYFKKYLRIEKCSIVLGSTSAKLLVVSTGLSLMLLCGNLVRNTMVTGSPFLGYVPLSSRMAPSFKYASEVFAEAGWATGVPPLRPGLPNAYPRILAIGYQFYPQIFIFLLFSFALASHSKNLALFQNNLILILFFLMWVTLLGMRSPRHLLFVLPFLVVACLHALQEFIEFFNIRSNQKTHMLGLIVAIALMTGFPFSEIGLADRSIPLLSGIFFAEGTWRWFASRNIKSVLTFCSFSTFLIIGARFLTAKSATFSRHATRLAVVSLLGAVIVTGLNETSQGVFATKTRYSTYQRYGEGRLAVLSWLSEHIQPDEKILEFHGWDNGYLLGLKNSIIPLHNHRGFASVAMVLQSSDFEEIALFLDRSNINYLLIPATSSTQYYVWQRIVEASNSIFLTYGYSILFEQITDQIPAPHHWELWRRRSNMMALRTDHKIDKEN
jgi:hypothetical protein